jgi:hypothetical protein
MSTVAYTIRERDKHQIHTVYMHIQLSYSVNYCHAQVYNGIITCIGIFTSINSKLCNIKVNLHALETNSIREQYNCKATPLSSVRIARDHVSGLHIRVAMTGRLGDT